MVLSKQYLKNQKNRDLLEIENILFIYICIFENTIFLTLFNDIKKQ